MSKSLQEICVPRTKAELLEGNDPSFTFGEWLRVHGWNVEEAVQGLEDLLSEYSPIVEQPEFDHLTNSVDTGQEKHGVWDGVFILREGTVIYSGYDGPCSGINVRERVVFSDDVITCY